MSQFFRMKKFKEAIQKEADRTVSGSSEQLREKSIARKAAAQRLAEQQAEAKFQAAEKEAFESGAEKKGGILGFGGTYSGKTKEDFMKGAGGADIAGAADKTQAAASLTQMLTGESVGSHLGGGDTGASVDGAMSGAAMGAKLGPWGAAAGAVAGAVMGAASARAARKAQERQIEAQKQRALGEIAMEEGKQLSTALGSMGARMSASFR